MLLRGDANMGRQALVVWDPHYPAETGFTDSQMYKSLMGITMQEELAKDYPGTKLILCLMEENS